MHFTVPLLFIKVNFILFVRTISVQLRHSLGQLLKHNYNMIYDLNEGGYLYFRFYKLNNCDSVLNLTLWSWIIFFVLILLINNNKDEDCHERIAFMSTSNANNNSLTTNEIILWFIIIVIIFEICLSMLRVLFQSSNFF